MDSFTPVPNEWFEHLADGRLTMPMFTILIYLKRACIWKTGVWRGNADKIAYNLNHELEKRQISRYLRRLHACGYITSHAVRGQRRPYKIDLNNYVAHHDDEDFLIRPTELKDWQDLPPDDEAVDDDEVAMTRRRHDAVDDDEVTNSTLDVPDLPDELDGLDDPDQKNQLVSKQVSCEESSLRSSSPPSTDESKTEKPTDPEADPLWLKFMAEDGHPELYDQICCGGLAEAMGLPYFYHEHIPMLQELTRWASQLGKDAEYMKGLWLWSETHKFWKTRILGLDSMVKAMDNQTEKGVVAQYNRVVARKQEKNNANGNGHAPLWVSKKLDDGTMLRSLGRKPMTAMERKEVLELLQQPKINREYILGFLVQDHCPECRGQDIRCDKCVITSEVMP